MVVMVVKSTLRLDPTPPLRCDKFTLLDPGSETESRRTFELVPHVKETSFKGLDGPESLER